MEKNQVEHQPQISNQPSHVPYWLVFIAGLFAAIILLLGGVMLGCVTVRPVWIETSADDEATTSAAIDETANWKTYSDTTYGFSFKYPSEYSQVTPEIPYYFQTNPLVSFNNSKSLYTAINYKQDAVFSVSVTPMNGSECYKLDTDILSTARTINGKSYYYGTRGGAAAGNSYDSEIYRVILEDGSCFEMSLNTHKSSDYNNISMVEIQKSTDAAETELNKILATFKITD